MLNIQGIFSHLKPLKVDLLFYTVSVYHFHMYGSKDIGAALVDLLFYEGWVLSSTFIAFVTIIFCFMILRWQCPPISRGGTQFFVPNTPFTLLTPCDRIKNIVYFMLGKGVYRADPAWRSNRIPDPSYPKHIREGHSHSKARVEHIQHHV